MALLVRKFTRGKWEGIRELNDLSADACTSCLRTSSNTLSLWEIPEDDEKELEEVALALVTSLDKIDRIQLIYFDKKLILEDCLEKTDGVTPIEELKKRHVDLIDINFLKLKGIAGIYLDAINQDNIKLFSKKAVENIVKKAIKEKRLLQEHEKEIRNVEIKELLKEEAS